MYDRCVKLILSKDSDIQPEPKVKIQVRHACNMVKIILNLLLTCELHGPPELGVRTSEYYDLRKCCGGKTCTVHVASTGGNTNVGAVGESHPRSWLVTPIMNTKSNQVFF